jgi:hypothetical protein
MTSAASARKQAHGSLEAAYATAVIRIILEAARALTAPWAGGGVPRRQLIAHLRGNRPPAPGGARDGFGLLESHRLAWVEEAVDRAIEEGLLELVAGPRGSARIVITAEGSGALEGSGELPASLLPATPLPGAHPGREERLRDLRRRIAAEEGVSAYVVFPNAVLAALAAKPPSTLAELAALGGMGEARVRKYGRRILALLRKEA